MKLRRLIHGVMVLALAAAFGWACDSGTTATGLDDDSVVVTQTLALQFVAQDTETACGTATGMRVVISDGEGETYSCDAGFAPGMVSDPYTEEGDQGLHYVADCLFTLAAGDYTIETVEVLGAEGVLECCSAEFDPDVSVQAGLTSEFSAMLTCPLIGPGALDIYGWLNRPPVLTKLSIAPSKFAGPCIPQFMWVEAVDREGDEITYTWQVLPTADKLFRLWPHGPWAVFMGSTGDYDLLVTVTDSHGASTSLQFPLHRVEPPVAGPMPMDASPEAACPDVEHEPEVPADLELP